MNLVICLCALALSAGFFSSLAEIGGLIAACASSPGTLGAWLEDNELLWRFGLSGLVFIFTPAIWRYGRTKEAFDKVFGAIFGFFYKEREPTLPTSHLRCIEYPPPPTPHPAPPPPHKVLYHYRSR